MRFFITFPLLLCLVGPGWSFGAEKDPQSDKAHVFSLPPATNLTAPSGFTDAQIAFVLGWIKQKVPDYPPALTVPVAESFLEELQQRQPEKLEQLLMPDFSTAPFDSGLLRLLGTKLTGAAQGPVREEIARKRVVAVLVTAGGESRVALQSSPSLIAKIKDSSTAQFRRLVEGRMEDDELELLLKKTAQAPSAPAPAFAVSAKPRELTSADIVSEFSRHNQAGSALQRLQAYTVEGRLKTATGEEQELLLFKMRPDRFRLVVRSRGLTNFILGFDGTHFWKQSPNQPPRIIPAQEMGSQLYLTEFVDPLFADDGFVFERREDGASEGKKFHRIAVSRRDGSSFVACIDAESFRETARETDDHTVAHYSDFRDVAGVIYAFNEELTDSGGRKGYFAISRITPNPGLIQQLFDLPSAQSMNYFSVERLLAPTPMPLGKPRP